MMFRNWWHRIVSRKDQLPSRVRRPAGRRTALGRTLALESLEDRTVPGFLPAVRLPVGVHPRAVTVADLNNDAAPDIAVVKMSKISLARPWVTCLLGLAALAVTGSVVRGQTPMRSRLTQQQFDNLAALSRLYMPTGAFGVNPDVGLGIHGGTGLLGGSLANLYANPSGAGTPANNPYGSGTGYEDPNGAILWGGAQTIDSLGRFLVNQQQAYLLREQVRTLRVANARKRFDELLYERENTPTAEEQRRRLQLQSAQRARNHPPVTEIWSGKSLNDILVDLQRQPVSGVSADRSTLPGLLDEAGLRQINVTNGTGSVGLLKNEGRLQWPVALAGSDYAKPRERLTALAQTAVGQAKANARVDAGTIQQMTGELDKLHRQLRTNGRSLSASEYIEAKRFLSHFDDAVIALQQTDGGNYLSGKYALKVKTVAELVKYMTEQGLRFAPALPGDRGAYVVLHQALATYGQSRQSQTIERKSLPSGDSKGTY